MIGNESARGTEFQAFGGSNPNHHLAIYWLIGGPMDYTQDFEMDIKNSVLTTTHVNSTCNQLALYVTM
jgi:hypothetical protein